MCKSIHIYFFENLSTLFKGRKVRQEKSSKKQNNNTTAIPDLNPIVEKDLGDPGQPISEEKGPMRKDTKIRRLLKIRKRKSSKKIQTIMTFKKVA